MLRPKNLTKPEEKFLFRSKVLPDDVTAVKNLCTSIGFFSGEEIEVAGELVEEYLHTGEKSGYNFIFCETGGNIIGYSCFGRIPLTKSSFDLYWIVVEKAWQRKGLGGHLLALSEAEVAKLGGTRIYAETSSRDRYRPTISFYENNGFWGEAMIKNFYAPDDSKLIFVKTLEGE